MHKNVGVQQVAWTMFKRYSDHRDLSFGEAYGVVMKELRLLARSVFVVNSNDEIVYVEYVSEGTNHPNYEAALRSSKSSKIRN